MSSPSQNLLGEHFIGYDRVRYSKSTYDEFPYKVSRYLFHDLGKSLCFDPFNEIMYCKTTNFTPISYGHRSDQVDLSLCKGPRAIIGLSSSGGILMMEVRRWHLSHLFTNPSTSCLIVGQKHPWRSILWAKDGPLE